MSCPDAHSATIVNSAVASSANARPARSVFKTISPPYFQPFGICKVASGNGRQRTTLFVPDARQSRKFHRKMVFSVATVSILQALLSLFLFSGFAQLRRKFGILLSNSVCEPSFHFPAVAFRPQIKLFHGFVKSLAEHVLQRPR